MNLMTKNYMSDMNYTPYKKLFFIFIDDNVTFLWSVTVDGFWIADQIYWTY
jgi:hypothetical protein